MTYSTEVSKYLQNTETFKYLNNINNTTKYEKYKFFSNGKALLDYLLSLDLPNSTNKYLYNKRVNATMISVSKQKTSFVLLYSLFNFTGYNKNIIGNFYLLYHDSSQEGKNFKNMLDIFSFKKSPMEYKDILYLMELIEKMSNSLGEFNLSPEKFINFLNLETDPWIQLNLIETYKFIFHSYSDNTIMKNLSMELIKFHLENYSKSTGKNNNIHSMMNNIRNTNSISGHYFDFAIALFIAKIKHRDLYNILMEFIFHFIENNLEMANFIDIMSKRYYSFNQCKILSYKNKIATLYDQKCKEDTYFYSNLKEKHS